MAVDTYDPLRVVLTFGSVTLTGFAPDTFVKITRDGEAYTKQVGAGGDVARTRNQDRSGSIEITLMATSASNDELTAIARLDEIDGSGVGPFQMKDLGSQTLCSAANAWVKKWPDVERAKETGVAVWVLDCDKLNMYVGGAKSS